jgi:hypothetical protein
MFESVKNKTHKQGFLSLLTFIVGGTQGEAGFAYVPKADAEKLLKVEPTFITLDASVKNAQGQIKAVATSVAIEALTNQAGNTAQSEPAAQKETVTTTTYEIRTLTVLPAILRGGKKADSYPFEKLAAFPDAGNSFFVPATEAKPNPAKNLASTVASANKRYKGVKEFTVRKETIEGKTTGALVIRTK